MGWIKHDNLTRHYQLRFRKRGKTKSLDFETKDEAVAYINYRKEMEQIEREFLDQERELEKKLNEIEQVNEELFAQTLICAGMFRRQKHWVAVKDLRIPLTKEEQNHIRTIKRKAIQWSLPTNFPSPISKSTTASKFRMSEMGEGLG